MGRHSHDDAAGTGDWEEPPPVAPLWRMRVVTSAVLLLAVIAATWWAVSWLMSPAGPTGAAAPQAVALDGEKVQPGGGPDGGALDGGQRHGAERDGGGPSGPAEAGTGQAGADQSAEGQPEGTAGSASEAVTVHVAGEVHEPGLVELPAGSRVADALRAAGGPTTRAELDLLNLAAPAVDASQILVPGPDTPVAASGTAPGTVAGAASGPGGTGGPGPAGTVNVNTADAAALEELPGIGPALAGRIVEHREQVGPYGSLADLDAVSGIGPAMMERLDGLVSW
jgi:competence protein ComEA